ncbi:MAG: hypothetical protein ACI4TW_00560 [Prevotella sp.]
MRRIRHITHPCRVKKLTLILLCSLLLPYSLHAWNYPTSKPSGAYSGGNGSASNPYQISTAQDLADLAYMVSENGEEYSGKYFVMTKDITLNEGLINDNCTGRNEGNFQIWRPIGKYGFFSDNDFSGNFNGNGHTIYGLYITVDAKDAYNGLFGSLDVAMVRNLTIADSYIVAGTPNYLLNMYGFFAGRTDKTTLLNCHVKNSCIKNTDSSSLLQVGGLIGRGWGEKNELHRCSFEGNIILESYTECSPMEVSGMVGGDNAKLYNCSTKGKITLGGYPSALLYGMAPVIIDAYGCVSAMDFEIKTNGEYYNGTFAEYRFLEVSSLGGIVQKATLCATYGDIKIGTKDDPIKVCTKNKEALNDRVVKIGTFSSSTLETEIVQCAAYTNVELYIDDECADNAYVTTFGRTYAQCKPEKITYSLVAGKHIIPANTPYSPVLIYDEGAQWGPSTWETAYEWVKTTLYCNTVNGVTDTDRLIDPTANTTSDKNKYKQIGTAYLTGQALLNELNALNTGSNQWAG